MIAIITAITAGYDELKPICPQEGSDVNWLCITDDPHIDPQGWTVRQELPQNNNPNLAAKNPKMLPAWYTGAEDSIWIDASFRITSPWFAEEVMSYAYPIAQFVHPWRDDIYEECAASVGLEKYAGQSLEEQVAAYRSEGHPEHWGLWAAGVIARHHTDSVLQMGYNWLEECKRWSTQDQLSEPYVLRNIGLRPDSLPGTHFENAWLSYEGSGRHG